MISGLFGRIPTRYWGLASLVGLTVIYLALFRYDDYGIDEGAARALLLNWSIVDQIANPVSFLGAPDLRALLFIPLDFHWAGDLIAAKVLTLFLMLGLALTLHHWAEEHLGSEVALIGTGLLMIAPVSVMQVDAIGKGPYLLLAFYLGYWFEARYRDSKRHIPGDYFTLLIAVALAVSLHPAGLALPAAIAWHSWKNPIGKEKWRNLLIGLAIITILFPIIRWGWPELNWWSDPLPLLGTIFTGPQFTVTSASWSLGLLVSGLLLMTFAFGFRKFTLDVFSLSLALSVLLGCIAPDGGWVLLSLALLLYFGTSLTISLNRKIKWRHGLVGERGMVIILIFLISTAFMLTDRHIRYTARHEIYSNTDAVIKRLAAEAADHSKPFLAASQWPGRTMLACKREVFPLPHAAKNPETLRSSIRGITHLAFDFKAPRNRALASQTAMLSDALETLELMPGGVILKARNQKD